ncbi:hypothetical protein [Anaeromyxobacter oryzae]|uniref:Terminase small subunit n=1 Tax=Anaeromyxobacter oryzae TaxID=2918170 RepID=A0ABN6MVI2_9BACT|nr:hypothetical protein [Anaeromyxobacter oryzae]BDG04992.1 hypothetical protein AMOR_39880 [Anaeromyxobacter oryzae]
MPTRVPSRVKKLRGTYRADRSSRNEPTPAASRVPPPPTGESAAFKRNWRELARQVDALSVFTETDYTAFRLLVRAVTLIDDLPPLAPPSAVARLVQNASGMLSRFGLDPASRGRVESVKPATGALDPDDEFAEPGLRVVK